MQANWLDAKEESPIDVHELATQGIAYQKLPLAPAEYQPLLTKFCAEHAYTSQDEVQLSPATENLQSICAKFIDEHSHDEDEVRFVLEGEGIFDIRSKDDRWMRVTVFPGDLLMVPAGRYHRFMLTEQQSIRCVRLFQNASGWTPLYREDSARVTP